jgi:dTDP-4-amino-4,6-dideoxygalactose transaminase
LRAVGVERGAEVVTSPFSFVSSANVALFDGARPVFADIDPETLNVDPQLAIGRIGTRTRAVVVVHLFGRMAQTAPLAVACGAAGIPFIEDAAQAIGAWRVDGDRRQADGRVGAVSKVGTVGAGAALSFFPSKNLGGFGDGGMVITDDEATASQVRLLRNHGAAGKLRHVVVGGNFRLDELQAALLRVKLPELGRWSAERRRIAAQYRERLAHLPIRLPPCDEGCVWNQFVVGIPGDRRGALIEHLDQRGIASGIYYPIPLHLQPALSGFGDRPGDFPCAEQAARETLALPIYPDLGDDRLARVADAVADFFR